MIFVPPRFIVVDDKPDHLRAIIDALQQLGSPCVGIHFKPAEEFDKALFRGVRALFLDLHLIEGHVGTDDRRHFALIAKILEDNIDPDGGPFILIIWTEYSHVCDQLTEYLDTNLASEKPYTRPLKVLPLMKRDFINTDNGDATAPETLRRAINDALKANPQMASLLGWETDVLTAAGDTLAALVGMVPSGDRTTAAFSSALDTILSRLAREAVGREHVDIDRRAAITTALAPILTDRIQNQKTTPEMADLWIRAVTKFPDRRLGEASPAEAGKINRMLHMAVPESQLILPTDWGAVVDFPGAQWNDADLGNLFGATSGKLLESEFKVPTVNHSQCRPCLVRVGAVCDYAQNRRGPITYLLGLEIPTSVTPIGTHSESEWKSPVLLKNEEDGPFRLRVNVRFGIIRPAGACETWSVRYRLREQLLMHLIHHTSVYGSRPGIVQLPIPDSVG